MSFLLPFSDPWLHIVADEESERKWGFSLRRTLREAPKTPLLANYKVHATKSVVPPPEQLKGTEVHYINPWLVLTFFFICIFSRNRRKRWRPVPQVAAQEYSVGRSQDFRDRIGLGQGVVGGGQEEEFARRRQGDSPHWPPPPRARF